MLRKTETAIKVGADYVSINSMTSDFTLSQIWHHNDPKCPSISEPWYHDRVNEIFYGAIMHWCQMRPTIHYSWKYWYALLMLFLWSCHALVHAKVITLYQIFKGFYLSLQSSLLQSLLFELHLRLCRRSSFIAYHYGYCIARYSQTVGS